MRHRRSGLRSERTGSPFGPICTRFWPSAERVNLATGHFGGVTHRFRPFRMVSKGVMGKTARDIADTVVTHLFSSSYGP